YIELSALAQALITREHVDAPSPAVDHVDCDQFLQLVGVGVDGRGRVVHEVDPGNTAGREVADIDDLGPGRVGPVAGAHDKEQGCGDQRARLRAWQRNHR